MTRFRVAKNSGAKEVDLIKVWRNANKRPQVNPTVVVYVNKNNIQSRLKRKYIFKSLVVRTILPFPRKDGCFRCLTQNSIIFLNKKGSLFGT